VAGGQARPAGFGWRALTYVPFPFHRGAVDTLLVTSAELETSLSVWLAAIGVRRPDLIRDLWPRAGEPRDLARTAAARDRLAAELVLKFTQGQFVVTRPNRAPDRGPLG